MTHIRLVHFHKAKYKIVCCRPGEEVLFPSANEFVTDWDDPVKDADRVATMRDVAFNWSKLIERYPDAKQINAGCLTPTQELICINSDKRIPFVPKQRGLKADVCLGVRQRRFCPERNWQHWQSLADAIIAAGHSVAVIGAKDTAPDIKGQIHHSGDYDTDAAIELLQSCKLYIGNDSGNSHLAATIGCPMFVFREEAGGSRDLVPRMMQVNSGQITYIKGIWKKPQTIIDTSLALLRGGE